MKKYITAFVFLLIGIFGVSSVYAISATGWTISGQNTNFDGTGFVGIGTLNPQSKVDISGMLNLKSTNDGGSQTTFIPVNGGTVSGTGALTYTTKFGIGNLDNIGLYIGRNPNGVNQGLFSDLFMSPLGNIGVNTTIVSDTRFNVNGTQKIQTAAEGWGSLFFQPQANSGNSQLYTFTTYQNKIMLGRTNGFTNTGVFQDFVINNSGSVGINNLNPTEKLDVIGNIKLSGNIKSNGNDICIGNC